MNGLGRSGTALGASGNVAHDLEISSYVGRPGMVGLVAVLVSFPRVRGRLSGVTSTIEPQVAICRYFTKPRDPLPPASTLPGEGRCRCARGPVRA